MPTGAQLLVETAAALGLDTLFTLVGDHLNEVLAEAARQGLRVIDMRHEAAVAHAADAWARIHRKPALSLVTGGPGHTNSLTGLATAQLAGSPLIAISGSRPSTLTDRQAFQDIDQVGMARPVVKWAAEPPSAAEIPAYFSRAFDIARSGRMGAVHLTIPVDLLRSHCDGPQLPSVVRNPLPLAPETDSIARAIALLREAGRPVVVAGSGVWWAAAEDALRQFIERTSIPLYTITMARGAVPDGHPLVMGYADPALNHAVQTVFREADLFLIVGKRIDYRLAMGGPRLFPPAARFLQIDLHEPEFGLNRKLDLAIHADARLALESLTAAAGALPWTPRPWLDRVRELRSQWQTRLSQDASDTAGPLHPAAFFRELASALPPGVLYSWDGGDFVHWGRALLPANEPGGWLRLGPLGAIGSSLPNGLALKLAYPDRPVAIITGDGALGFYLAEMDTLVRHRTPAVLIVGNDSGWGLERELQSFASARGNTVACELRWAHYEVIMQAFGGAGETIDRLDQVRPAVARAFASGVPYCLNVKIRGVRSPFTEWQIAGKKL
jgi:acetolactate synthase-1/2/3 large subunit